jgi:hypothetical protein
VDVKGWKAIGNRIEDVPLINVKDQSKEIKSSKKDGSSYKPGDTIEFDF